MTFRKFDRQIQPNNIITNNFAPLGILPRAEAIELVIRKGSINTSKVLKKVLIVKKLFSLIIKVLGKKYVYNNNKKNLKYSIFNNFKTVINYENKPLFL
ncbi:hypothetical protein [Rickettsia akari]|nr:hypothetical protein [Rickettsia akari]